MLGAGGWKFGREVVLMFFFRGEKKFFGHGLGMKKIVVIFVVKLGKIVFSKGTEKFFDLGLLEKGKGEMIFSTLGD